jgi:endo-1,4-beta-xylanase
MTKSREPLMRRRQVILGATLGLASLGLARTGQPVANRSLKAAAARSGRLWGAAVSVEQLQDGSFRTLVLDQAALIVPEHEMKWDGLEPDPGRFDFSAPDRLLQFAHRHGMGMRGHTLVWHQQLPRWLVELPAAETSTALEQYITAVVGHYRGQLQSWDVVNEPIAEDGSGLRKSLWLERLGPHYIEKALRLAHRADSTVPLLINDYGLEGDDPTSERKRQQMLQLLRDLRQRRVPLQAIGLQAHLYATADGPTFRRLPDFLQALADLDLDIYVTELDVNDRELPAAIAQRDARVAEIYEAFLAAIHNQPRLIMITSWGLSDRYTWLNEHFPRSDGFQQRPLPFDANYMAKPAEQSILEVLK